MFFSRMLASFTLAFLMAVGASTAAFSDTSTPSTTPPPEAPVQASNCITVDVVINSILQSTPNADIKSVSSEPPYVVVFTSPDRPNDFQATFDENGCFVEAHEISKVGA